MTKRKKAAKPEYSFIHLKITNYKAYVDASINYEVRDKNHYHDDSNVFDFGSHIETEGNCIWTDDDTTGHTYHITIYVSELRSLLTLPDPPNFHFGSRVALIK